MGRQHRHAEVGQTLVRAGGQVQPPGGREVHVRAGDGTQHQFEVARAAGDRARHVDVLLGKPGRRVAVAAQRHQPVTALVREHAAVVRRVAQRRADVGAHIEKAHAGADRRRAAARGTARRARRIVRIACGAVDRVVALPVAQAQRHIGLAEQDGALGAQALHHHGIALGTMIGARRAAAGGGPAGHVERFLDRERHTVQRPKCGAGLSAAVTLAGRRAGGIEVRQDKCVDRRMMGDPRGVAGRNQRLRGGLAAGELFGGSPDRQKAVVQPARVGRRQVRQGHVRSVCCLGPAHGCGGLRGRYRYGGGYSVRYTIFTNPKITRQYLCQGDLHRNKAGSGFSWDWRVRVRVRCTIIGSALVYRLVRRRDQRRSRPTSSSMSGKAAARPVASPSVASSTPSASARLP
ncbi:hypothetical protein D3C87_1244370 [compost metagenome]